MKAIRSINISALVILDVFMLILAQWNTNDYLKREHSLVKPYSDERWDYIGSTVFSNSYVRLTPDHQSRKGAIWNNVPCMVRHWELQVEFKVHGKGNDLYGDGFAIWYTKDKMELGPIFGNKDQFVGLAVVLDTYSNQNSPHNHGHPYVSAMINNGSLRYDHDRDGTHTELAGCQSSFRRVEHNTYMSIKYERLKLTVSMDIAGKNAWLPCFTVDGVHLPTGYYFGASAATGDLADNHDIISMKLYDISIDSQDDDRTIDYTKIVPSAEFFAPIRDHVEDPAARSFIWSLFLVVVVAIIVAITIVFAYFIYTNTMDSSRKRFY